MAILLTILLWLLGIVGVVLLLAVFMPLSVSAWGVVELSHADGLVDGRWAWGLVGVRATPEMGVRLRLFGLNVARIKGDADKKKDKKKRKEPKAEKKSKRGLRWAWNNRTLFRRLLRALHIRGAVRGDIGLGDPADTAMLGALLRPLTMRRPAFEIHLDWDYIDEALELEGEIRARLWPAEVVWILLATLVRGESRRALFASN